MSGRDPRAELERLVRLVRSARHSMNNALMGLMGNVEILSDRGDLPEPAQERLAKIMSQARQLGDEIRKLESVRRLGSP